MTKSSQQGWNSQEFQIILITCCRDVSRVHHCILGRNFFSLDAQNIAQRVAPIGHRKKIKNQMFMQITHARENMQTPYFTTNDHVPQIFVVK